MKKMLLFSGVTLTVFLLDQLSKFWALEVVPERWGAVSVIPCFDLVHVWNKGMSFGLLSEAGASWFFIMLACGAGVFLTWSAYREPSWPQASCYGAITGGALGNAWDRLQHAAVFDFLDFYWETHHFPAFNFADSAISVGVLLLIFFQWRQESQPGGHSKKNP